MKHYRGTLLLLRCLFVFVIGADQALSAESANPNCPGTIKETSGFGSKHLTLNDFWEYKTGEKNDVAENFGNTYTRLLVLNNKNLGKAHDDIFDYESPWLPRLVRDINHSYNLTAKVVVGNFETTVPLATISHDDGMNGEYWTKSIHYDQQNFPLFLIPADGSAAIPTISLTMTLSEAVKSNGASRGLEAALAYARATSPGASVITQLSEQTTKDRAHALDNVISSLFSNSIKEEHSTDRDLRLLHADCKEKNIPAGLTVRFDVPKNEGKWNEPTQKSVGEWTLTFDYPHLSVFSDWRICNNDVTMAKCAKSYDEAKTHVTNAVTPSNVLSYRLISTPGNPVSIRTYLSQQDWFTTAMNELAGTDADAVKLANSKNLCRRIENEITTLGLSSLDAQIVVWAVINGMPLPPNAPNFSTQPPCNAFKGPNPAGA
jgi:hypothetical protein